MRNWLIFFAANVILVAVFASIFLPRVNSVQETDFYAQRLRNRYLIAQLHLAEYENNLRELEEMVIPGLLPALAYVSQMHVVHGLTQTSFQAFEPVGNSVGGEVILDMRVAADYEGSTADILAFLYDFVGGYGNVRSFSFTKGDDGRLRMEFSIIGIN